MQYQTPNPYGYTNPAAPAPQPPKKGGKAKWIGIGAAAFVGLGIIGALLPETDKKDTKAADKPAATATSEAPKWWETETAKDGNGTYPAADAAFVGKYRDMFGAKGLTDAQIADTGKKICANKADGRQILEGVYDIAGKTYGIAETEKLNTLTGPLCLAYAE